ncbi:MAG: hypothetical protein RL367_2793 [Pseudomonadota bacterium]
MSLLLLVAAAASPVAANGNGGAQTQDCRTRYMQASAQNQPQRDSADTRRRQPAPKPDRPVRPCYIMASA